MSNGWPEINIEQQHDRLLAQPQIMLSRNKFQIFVFQTAN